MGAYGWKVDKIDRVEIRSYRTGFSNTLMND